MVAAPTIAGRYRVLGQLGAGGMASVHLGQLVGPAGFARLVALKRMHPHLAGDPTFVRMFLDEGRLAASIRHPNVVATLDVVATPDDHDVLLVMDYVDGESLANLLRAAAASDEPPPLPIVAAIMVGLLDGLHAAHETKAADGSPLGVLHRDVSPENVLVGVDGIARVGDFGVAKPLLHLESTASGALRGKLGYLAPERLLGSGAFGRAVDIYAAGIVLWEALTSRTLFRHLEPSHAMAAIMGSAIPLPSTIRGTVPSMLDEVVARATAHLPSARYASAREMAAAIEAATAIASPREVGAWVERVARESLAARAALVASVATGDAAPASATPLVVRRRFPAAVATNPLPSEGHSPPEALLPLAHAPVEPPPPLRRSRVVRLGLRAALAGVALTIVAIILALRVPHRPSSVRLLTRASSMGTASRASAFDRVGAGASAAAASPAVPAPSAPPGSAPAIARVAPNRRAPTSPVRGGRSCSPPYVIEADGAKRFRTECL